MIAGSRSITDINILYTAIADAGFTYARDPRDYVTEITYVVSGCAPGVDCMGEEFVKQQHIPVVPYPAAWEDITAPGAVIRTRPDGTQYNKRAGTDRNIIMAEYADVALLLWDGVSPGTRHMQHQMRSRDKDVYLVNLKERVARWYPITHM